jgi:hypothetical protein
MRTSATSIPKPLTFTRVRSVISRMIVSRSRSSTCSSVWRPITSRTPSRTARSTPFSAAVSPAGKVRRNAIGSRIRQIA